MDWQPMETAPSKTLVWLLVDGDRYIGYRSEPSAWSEDKEGDWILKVVIREGVETASTHHTCKSSEQPTHWMPLPDAPDAQT